jgi:hypothetical protein
MSGSSTYPGALDSDLNLPRVTDESVITPELWNNLTDAIESIEGTLGVNPQGGSETVAARLDAGGGGGGGGVTPAHVFLAADTSLLSTAATDLVTLDLAAGTYVGWGFASLGADTSSHFTVTVLVSGAEGIANSGNYCPAGEYVAVVLPFIKVLATAETLVLRVSGPAGTAYRDFAGLAPHASTGLIVLKVA